ncbi:MAG TPA: hypothetical protein VG965_07215 [Patescibacteria group bacterium]|nr:hypothetical protein [Patescibacteria group bacterium]
MSEGNQDLQHKITSIGNIGERIAKKLPIVDSAEQAEEKRVAALENSISNSTQSATVTGQAQSEAVPKPIDSATPATQQESEPSSRDTHDSKYLGGVFKRRLEEREEHQQKFPNHAAPNQPKPTEPEEVDRAA